MTAEAAIAWVDQNVKRIAGHSRKYLPYAPYDQEDFLQDAYEAALEAATVSTERQVIFPACFWNLYKGKLAAVTPNPESKSKSGSTSPSRKLCDSSAFTSKRFAQEDNTCHLEPLFNIDADQAYPYVRDYLTPKEEQILEALLGIHGGTMKIKEAARHLECSPANVRQALNRSCRRISLLVASGDLDAEFVESEIMKQFEVVLETQELEVNKIAKPEMRRDAPSGEDSQRVQPRYHRDPHNRRKADSHCSIGTKARQTSHINSKVEGNERFSWHSIGVASFLMLGADSINIGGIPTSEDFMGLQSIGRTGPHYDLCLEDMMAFVASNNSSTIRSIVSCSHRESRKEPADNVISLFNRKEPPASILDRNVNRNKPMDAYSDRYGGSSSVKQDQSRHVVVVQRKRNIEQSGRNEPISILNDMVSVGDLDEPTQLAMAA